MRFRDLLFDQSNARKCKHYTLNIYISGNEHKFVVALV